ncbi:unnamed protein product [marine sediment metagenome]|uniref:Uncharacterized protein n=1 Tax=marine sediment metagenome TaxID=412755 RepID=X1HR37_9ZZZZ
MKCVSHNNLKSRKGAGASGGTSIMSARSTRPRWGGRQSNEAHVNDDLQIERTLEANK